MLRPQRWRYTPFKSANPIANIPREGANLASRILGGKVREDPLHTEQIPEAVPKLVSERDTAPTPALRPSEQRRQAASAGGKAGPLTGLLQEPKAKPPICPTPNPAQSATHTHHTRGTRLCYVGLSLHVNVAAHSRERTRGLVAV